MMDLITEPLSQAFMVHALIAGTIVGGLCALVGVFVVQRGLAFIGDGLAHAAFGGIALGLLLEVAVDNATLVALPFTVIVALGIGFVLRRGGLRADVAVGVFFSVSLALGVLFLGLRPPEAPAVNIESVLFGSILVISMEDLYVVLGVAGATTIVLGLTWSRLAYMTFDPELAALSGVPVAALEYMLLAIVAVVIVVSVETVGIALVSSFIVIPAATANMVGRTLTGVALLSLGLGVGAAALGLFLSYHLSVHFNVASGATIILTLGVFFTIGLLFRRRR
jgi:zinc transport system permease protein